MKRCRTCLLPDTYPGISFDSNGECNFCANYTQRQYNGTPAFKNDLELFLEKRGERNNNYDCLLGFSGGRDSSYLLYWLKEIAGLKVLAYTSDNGFIPVATRENIRNITDSLKVDLIIDNNEMLQKCKQHTLSTWISRPSIPMIETLCTGCRLGLFRGILKCARQQNIPAIILGGTPYEHVPYRQDILKISAKGSNISRVMGYTFQIMKNPKWLTNYHYLDTQMKEFVYFFYFKRLADAMHFKQISPYHNYIKWDEQEISSVLKDKLDWKKEENTSSSWRSDCQIALLKLYIYKKAFGFNDKLDHLCHLIRDGQLGREEALMRLKKEEKVSPSEVRQIIDEFDIPYRNFNKALNSMVW